MIDTTRRVMKVGEASRAYCIGKTKLFALLKAGTVSSVKVGGSRLVHIDSLEALIAAPRTTEQHQPDMPARQPA
jgi:hypothetical protein